MYFKKKFPYGKQVLASNEKKNGVRGRTLGVWVRGRSSNFQFERGVAALIIIIREKQVVEEPRQFSRNSYCMLICSKTKFPKAKISLAQKNEGKKKQTPHPPTPLIYPLKISHLVRNPPTCNTPAQEGSGQTSGHSFTIVGLVALSDV